MSAGDELFGPICGTRAGTVAAWAIAIELPEVSAPRMQSAPFEIIFRAALTPPSGVVPSSAYSIWIVTSLTPACLSAVFACCTARPAAFAYAGPKTADAPVNGTTTPIRSVKPSCDAPLAVDIAGDRGENRDQRDHGDHRTPFAFMNPPVLTSSQQNGGLGPYARRRTRSNVLCRATVLRRCDRTAC